MLKYYFASANSGKGFLNYFPQNYSELNYHYIIKGGPGTGKSSLMKAIAHKADSMNMEVSCYLCSSDPDSLDGIIIKDLSIGITDGTAPHTSEPNLPGVKEEIINLGQYWDKDKLRDNKSEITKYATMKSAEFKNAYQYLASVLNIRSITDSITKEFINIQKADSFVQRMLKKLDIKQGLCKTVLIDAITIKGHRILDTYISDADQCYYIDNDYGISGSILECIKSRLQGCEYFISHEALDPHRINMIYIPSCRILFSSYPCNDKQINTKRFIDKEKYSQAKSKLKENKKLEALLTDMAYSRLKYAGEHHFALEKIYIDAMDFSKKEAEQSRLIKEIFS